jgi:hypothetical protein
MPSLVLDPPQVADQRSQLVEPTGLGKVLGQAVRASWVWPAAWRVGRGVALDDRPRSEHLKLI